MTCIFLTDTELFGWSKPQARRRPTAHSTVAPEIFFADVKPGDYVVHLEHGVGVYDGLVKLEVGGMQREYLQVSYARNDKLYVPVHQADRLSRYVGAGEKTPADQPPGHCRLADGQRARPPTPSPTLPKTCSISMPSAKWRAAMSYSPDGPWQDEMAASFPYEETDDQLHAIEAVRQDMESDTPDGSPDLRAMWAMARPRWRCAPPSRRLWMANRSPCSSPPPSWPSSTIAP